MLVARCGALMLVTALTACGDDAPHAAPFVASDAAQLMAADDAAAADAGPQPASYAAVVDIVQRSCSYVRCHDGPIIGASLSFARGSNYARSLVSITSCEYDRMVRIEPFQPDRSWLMVKLTASFRDRDDPYANYIYFDPDADWDPSQRGCRDQTDSGDPLFGERMPLTAPNMLPEDEIETIRQWILDGAPHAK